MDIAKYSRVLRSLVTEENARGWQGARDKEAFCSQLVSAKEEHPIIEQILTGALNDILALKAAPSHPEQKANVGLPRH